MINYLARAYKAKNNEFYTEYKTMEYLFESPEQAPQFCEFVKNKIIYLPCDTEDSNIYKYFVNNQEKLKIKEILRTSDDYYSHLDLYEKCDLIFTNPPFTGLVKYVKWLDETMNKKFVLWWGWMGLSQKRCTDIPKLFNGVYKILTFNGEVSLYSDLNKKGVNCLIFTNIEEGKQICLDLNPTKDIKELPVNEEGIPYINYARDFPKDYYGNILVPPKVYLERQPIFEYLGEWRYVEWKPKKIRMKILTKLK